MASIVETTNATAAIMLNDGDDLAVISNVSVAVGDFGDAVVGAGANELTADGSLYGDNGFYDSSSLGGDFIALGSQGEITGQVDGVQAAGGSDALVNAGTIESLTGCGVQFGAASAVSNSGTIAGFDYAINDQGGDSISNTGLIESQFSEGSTICESAGMDLITNRGTIVGDGVAYNIYLNGGGDIIHNCGAIEGGVYGILMGGGANNVTNSGTISATGVALRYVGTGSTLSDSGEIDGDVLFDGGDTGVVDATIARGGALFATPGDAALTITSGAYNIKNSGEITSPQDSVGPDAADGIDLAGAGSISNYGVIDAANVGVANSDAAAGDQSVLHNYGTISGGQYGVVDTGGHSDEIYNYGHIDCGHNSDAIYADANCSDYIFNRGSISGNVQLGLGGSSVVNSGTIDGEIVLESWGAISNSGDINQCFFASWGAFSNSGKINQIIFASTVSGASLRNSGTIESNVNSADKSFVLDNSSAIDGSVTLNGRYSQLFNSGEIAGGVGFGLGNARFNNNGTIIGNVTFAGTGNVYDGANGSVTGRIVASGTSGTYIGGADDDTFVFAASMLSSGDVVQGRGGGDTLRFSSAGTISASALANVSGMETIDLANGTNSITLTNALVSFAANATLTVNGGSGKDTIDASRISTATDSVVIDGGGGADTILAGGAHDTFVYKSARDSTGEGFDTISGADFANDVFQVPGGQGSIAAVDDAVTRGSLSTGSKFSADLAAAIGANQLRADAAVLFTASKGGLAHQTFLIVDLNGTPGYQAKADLVIHLTGATGTLTTANFV